MIFKRALVALILSMMSTAMVFVPSGAAFAVSSPKPPGCGTSTTPQCENY